MALAKLAGNREPTPSAIAGNSDVQHEGQLRTLMAAKIPWVGHSEQQTAHRIDDKDEPRDHDNAQAHNAFESGDFKYADLDAIAPQDS